MNDLIVIGTSDKKKFFECWTEGDTIFLTENINQAELFSDLKKAQDYLITVNKCASRFLDQEEKEIKNPDLNVWIAKFTLTFIDGTV